MSRFLGIDWDHNCLRVVEASFHRGKLDVVQTRSWPEPNNLGPATAAGAGKRLRQLLDEAGIKPAPAIFCVGRDRMICRDIRYPDVPAEEVPAVVRFQAVKELTFPAEQAVIDYALCSVLGSAGEKRALAVIVRKDLLDTIKTMCESAGLRLESVGSRPFGIVANWQASNGAASPHEASAILVLDNGTGDFCVAQGSELLFSRTITPGESANGNGSGLASELRRSLAAYAAQFPQPPVRTIYAPRNGLFDSAAIELSSRLSVQEYDPLPNRDGAERDFAGVLGLLQAKLVQQALPVDFLNIKEPKPPESRKGRYMLIAAGILAVLLIGGIIYTLMMSLVGNQIAQLQADGARLDKQIKDFGDVQSRFNEVKTWDDSEIVVLDELYDLIARFPDESGITLERVHWKSMAQETAPAAVVRPGTPPRQASKPTAKPVGQLEIEARSPRPESLRRLRRSLEEAGGHWSLVSWDDATTPNQAKAVLRIFPLDPKDYRVSLGTPTHTTATSSDQRDPRRRPFNRPGFQFRRGGGQ